MDDVEHTFRRLRRLSLVDGLGLTREVCWR